MRSQHFPGILYPSTNSIVKTARYFNRANAVLSIAHSILLPSKANGLGLPFMETTFAEGSRSGLSVSYKRADK
jgi:hypothetical protein